MSFLGWIFGAGIVAAFAWVLHLERVAETEKEEQAAAKRRVLEQRFPPPPYVLRNRREISDLDAIASGLRFMLWGMLILLLIGFLGDLS